MSFSVPSAFFILSSDPVFRTAQLAVLAFGLLDMFLILFATRDVLLRSRSFFFQAFAILITAVLPFFGFFLYVLIRPSQTIRQRETDAMLRALMKSKKEVVPEGQMGLGFPPADASKDVYS